MYAPSFSITNKILRSIGSIEAAREVIDYADFTPEFEKQFRNEAIVRSIYHGTHIEGNDLTLNQTKQILEGATHFAQNRDVQEVINARKVMNLVDDLIQKGNEFTPDTLRDIHGSYVYGIVSPEKAGFFRTTQVVIREEETGEVIFTPPAAFQVPHLLSEFFEWLNSEGAREIHTVIRAAIAHYVLLSIHPFVEGSGSATRAFANLIMFSDGFSVRRFYSLEAQIDLTQDDYYDLFFETNKQSEDIVARDLTGWIEYLCESLAVELTALKDQVRSLTVNTRAKAKIGDQVALSARQMKLLDYISENGRAQMRELKPLLSMVSDDTILRDLTDMVKKGIIEKEGTTKASSYILKQ